MKKLLSFAYLVILIASSITALGSPVRPPLRPRPALPNIHQRIHHFRLRSPTSNCQTTGQPWIQAGFNQGGICEPFHTLVKGFDGKFGGDGLDYHSINWFEDVCQDDVSVGPVYASPGTSDSSHSWFDATYNATALPSPITGCRSLIYTNEEVVYDYKDFLGDNRGGDGICTTNNDRRDTQFLQYVASLNHAETMPVANDDVVHASSPMPKASISTGDGDSGRITGGSTVCSIPTKPDVTVYKYMMNPKGPDVQAFTTQYMRGFGPALTSPSPFPWGPTPQPSASNPNSNGNTCDYDSSKLGAISCYDIFYMDQSAPHYDRGQSGSNHWTQSQELDPLPKPLATSGVWAWTNSYPGVVNGAIALANSLLRPTGTGPGDTGLPFPVWFNGFATSNGGTLADDAASPPRGATVESCNADELGGHVFSSSDSATNIIGGSIEDSWIDDAVQVPEPGRWAVDMNCASDIEAEPNSFAEIGGHSTALDSPNFYPYFDLNTTSATAVLSPGPTTIVLNSPGPVINGSNVGQHAYTLEIDKTSTTGKAEFVSVSSSNSVGNKITANFINSHPLGVTVTTMSPYSYRITAYALDLMAYQPGKTVIQMKYLGTDFDLPVYPEALLYPVHAKSTMAPFVGSPASATVSPAPSPSTGVTLHVSNTNNFTVGQRYNLFDIGPSGRWESVMVTAFNPILGTVTVNHVTKNHTLTPLILRGTQAFDGCQIVNGSPIADLAAIGGIADFLINNTCGSDGLTPGTSHPGGVYCREFSLMSYYGGVPFTAAACVNMTNTSIHISALAAPGCGSGYCLTQSYTHVCGAIDNRDDGCLGATSPISVMLNDNIPSPSPSPTTVAVNSTVNINVNGSYQIDASNSKREVITVLAIPSPGTPGTIQAVFTQSHVSGALITAPSSTIQVDDSLHGGGGKFCGASYPNFTLTLSSCPPLTLSDTIPPMSGVILLQ